MSKSKSNKTHIIKRESGWAIKNENSSRATKVFSTKEKAVKEATKKAKSGGDVIVHKKDGTIQEWRTYAKK
jgi:hypothetical protein